MEGEMKKDYRYDEKTGILYHTTILKRKEEKMHRLTFELSFNPEQELTSGTSMRETIRIVLDLLRQIGCELKILADEVEQK